MHQPPAFAHKERVHAGYRKVIHHLRLAHNCQRRHHAVGAISLAHVVARLQGPGIYPAVFLRKERVLGGGGEETKKRRRLSSLAHGGQSPMYTFVDNAELHRFVARVYEMGKVVAVVCHGTCLLLKTKLSDGKLLVEGKTWTGFANSEEQYVDSVVGKRLQPFWIEEAAKKIPNTNFITGYRFQPFAIRDGRLITGQQQFSGGPAARLVIEALGV